MIKWFRKIPHPSYGNWCGAKNTHIAWDGKKPIDKMDRACRYHDFKLRSAINKKEELKADAYLWKRMKKIKPKTLSLYGKLYRRCCLIIFKNKYCK